MTPRRSATWKATLRLFYAVIGALDPLVRWRWARAGIGITSLLTVPGRRSGAERSVLVGLISVGGRWYVGHPNGEVAWTANLRAPGRARLAPERGANVDVVASPLERRAERDAVIVATAAQQPFAANLLYRAAAATSSARAATSASTPAERGGGPGEFPGRHGREVERISPGG